MNIALFGASGGTGKLLTERCLAAGHTVSALVRTPEKFPYSARVRVIKGSAFDTSAVAETLLGADAVLSALGAKSPFKKEDVLQRAIPFDRLPPCSSTDRAASSPLAQPAPPQPRWTSSPSSAAGSSGRSSTNTCSSTRSRNRSRSCTISQAAASIGQWSFHPSWPTCPVAGATASTAPPCRSSERLSPAPTSPTS